MMRAAILCAVALLAYLATGVYFVQPDQQVVVRRFGRLLESPRQPGAHLGLPWGLDRRDWLRPREVKRVTIGPIRMAQDPIGSVPFQFLTGDRNLIDVQATVQFTITDPPQYLFQTAEVNRLVATMGEATLTYVLADQPVDRALTQGKHEIGILAREKLQELVDRYELGMAIRSVDIGAVEPPAEVAEAFADVTSALREREQLTHQAHSFANKTRAQAQADAQRLVDQSRAYQDRIVRHAQGEAERFERLLAEFSRAPELTARRLYLETMADILPKFRSKLFIDAGSNLDLSILREENR